ncbi:MAG: chemotaxis protein CheW [Desulfuromonas sp.]|nr:chemotaxis protein CheW [Desulfuromonas sp.]
MAGLQESLLPIFIEEAAEGLSLINKLVQVWEENTQLVSADILEDARRAAHTIKGTAGLVKRMHSSRIAKGLEEYLDNLKSGSTITADDIDVVRGKYSKLSDLLQYARNAELEPEFDEEPEQEVLVDEDASHLAITSDLINDFALPFMMKLHQASTSTDESVKPVCCRFFYGGRQYYIPIENVVEIAEREPITFLPYGPAYISGLINLRGNVIPVINMAELEKRNLQFPNSYFLVVARTDTDLMAFISDQLPNLSLKTAGHKIDVNKFLEQNSVKA